MNDNLSRHEWMLMEVLWDNTPQSLSDITKVISAKVDWKKSTYLTYLKRLTDKGYISYEMRQGSRAYFPLKKREECAIRESRSVLGRMTDDSKKIFLTNMIKESDLSSEDIDDLERLINQLRKQDGEEQQ